MRQHAVVATALTLVALIPVAALGVLLFGHDDRSELPASAREDEITAAPPATPTPFIDSRPELAKDPRRVIQLIAKTMGPVANATVVTLEEMTYGEAMCGLTSYIVPHPDVQVWVVAIDGVWQPFPSRASPPGPYRAVKASVIDAATGISLQTFSPWPLIRDPKAGCTR